jgi:membrane associated rhomboid family serine protease
MLPIRELRPEPLARPPTVVRAVVWANVAAFLLQLALPSITRGYAFVPRTLEFDPAFSFVTILTSMFLHAGFWHLLGNLWFLWIFGPSIEATLGSRRFALMYLLSGIGAALAQTALGPAANLPMLGASGAISGVLAAYVSLFPRRRIDTLAFIFVLPIPALFFVVEWFAMNLLSGIGSLAGTGGGVAWWAHIGGFLTGLVLVRVLFPGSAPPLRPNVLPREVEVRGPNGERYVVTTLNPRRGDPPQAGPGYENLREPYEWTGRPS